MKQNDAHYFVQAPDLSHNIVKRLHKRQNKQQMSNKRAIISFRTEVFRPENDQLDNQNKIMLHSCSQWPEFLLILMCV